MIPPAALIPTELKGKGIPHIRTCDPLRNLQCPDNMTCDVDNGICVDKKTQGDSRREFEFEGKKYIGSPSKIKKIKTPITEQKDIDINTLLDMLGNITSSKPKKRSTSIAVKKAIQGKLV
jgi:hypothetical protein